MFTLSLFKFVLNVIGAAEAEGPAEGGLGSFPVDQNVI
jgi:hypothetical protein